MCWQEAGADHLLGFEVQCLPGNGLVKRASETIDICTLYKRTL